MAKLKLYRQSGEIVHPQAREAYNEEFKQLYDKAEKKAEAIYNKKSGKLQLVPSMIIMQRLLRYIDRQLHRKHAIDVEIEIPKSQKQMIDLIKQYEDTPVLFARTQDGKGLVAILMDTLNQ